MDTSVYISNENIQAVVGKSTSRSIALRSFISEPLPEGMILNGIITNDEMLRQNVSELWDKYSLPQKNIKLIIDGTFIYTKTLRVPKTSTGNILKIIKNEFADIESTNEMLYDYSVLKSKSSDGGMDILCCAVEKSYIASYLELFEPLKIGISSINLALSSCIKLTGFLDFLKDQTYVITAIDGSVINVMLFVNGSYKISNRTRIIEERGTAQSVNEITRILSNMIQFNKSEKSGYDISNIFFCGLRETETKACKTISELLGIDVSVLPESRNILPESQQENPQSFKLSDYFYSVGNLI